jgi:arylamine N-acetyltransferase
LASGKGGSCYNHHREKPCLLARVANSLGWHVARGMARFILSARPKNGSWSPVIMA